MPADLLSRNPMATLALIGLGSNLGDRKAILDAAVASLAATPRIESCRVSTYHETAPVGGPSGQGPFLNAAAAVETNLAPTALHRVLIEIEQQAGRERRVRWGERTLDLDLLLFGDLCLDQPDLTLPHPRMAFRRFVLAPLAEIAPGFREPMTGRSIEDLLRNLDRGPSYVAIDRVSGAELARDVAAELASSLAGDLVLWDHMPGLAGSREIPNRANLDSIEAAAHALQRAHERAVKAGEGTWIVSDFSLTRELDRARALVLADCLANRGFFRFRVGGFANRVSRLTRRVERLATPTFLVMPSWSEPYLSLAGLESHVPLLVPEGRELEGMVAEILAACAASRG